MLERRWFLPCAFAVIGLAIYGSSLHNGFVQWDDTYLLTRNPIVRSISLQTLWYAFSTYDPELYIPLTFVSYQLTYLVAGASPFAVHLVNLALHVCNALLVAGILRRWFRPEIAACCGLIMLVHPLHAEAVAWSSARKDLLSGLFFLLSLRSTLRSWDRGNFPGSGMALFALGLLSKVTVFTLPVLLVVERWHAGKLDRKSLLHTVPFFLLSIVFGVIALAGKKHIESPLSLLQTIALAAQSTIVSIKHFALPLQLSPIYEVHETVGLFGAPSIRSLCMLFFLAGAVAWSLRRTKSIAFGAMAFLFMYAPSFLTFSKGSAVMLTSDRYAYLPSIGLLIIVGWLLERIVNMRAHAKPFIVAAVIATISLGRMTHRQALIWKDTGTLFGHAYSLDPLSVHAATNLGVHLTKAGQWEEAETILRKISTQRPLAGPLVALGTLLEQQHRSDEALAVFAQAIAAEPSDPSGYFAYADALMKDGKAPEAIAALRGALERSPSHAPAMHNLAALLFEEGNVVEAEELFRQVLLLNPYYSDAHFNYALLLQRTGRHEESVAAFRAALRAQPSLTPALQVVIPALLAAGDTTHALALLSAAIEDDPSNTDNGALALESAKRILAKDANHNEAKELVERMLTLGILQRKTP